MIRLGPILREHRLRQSHLAQHLGIGRSTLCELIQGRPARVLDGREGDVTAWLTDQGVPAAAAAHWALEIPSADHPTPAGDQADTSEDTDMLIAAQRLQPEELERLGLPRNPFADDIRAHADVYLPPSHRRIREAMWQAVQHRGLLAVYGESGCGKTVLRRDLLARAATEDPSVIPILPYTLGMDETQGIGRRAQALRAGDIAEVVIRRLDPEARLRATRMGRYHQAEALLTECVRSGGKPVLIIEEAHRMGRQTLRHLKGWAELEMGYAGLLSIILIGQSELADLLSEKDPKIREVVQRFEPIRVPPISDVPGYLRHKFARGGADLDQLADGDALAAIQERLDGSAAVRRGAAPDRVPNLCYPLAAQNLLVSALRASLAVSATFRGLTRDHVEELS
jgi:type II secretory pathway predicted ATPase ExeA